MSFEIAGVTDQLTLMEVGPASFEEIAELLRGQKWESLAHAPTALATPTAARALVVQA